MNWFFIAVACALCTACCDSISKRVMQHTDEWVTGTIILGISSLLLSPLLFFIELKPFTLELGLLLTIALPLEIGGYYLFLSAIKSGPLSLTIPLLAFTPVLTAISSALLLGEGISASGALGIVLVTVGAYILNGDLACQNFLAPIKALVSQTASRKMLMVAVIWSVTSSLGKIGTMLWGAVPFGILLLYGIVPCFGIIALIRVQQGLASLQCSPTLLWWFLAGGGIMAGAEITHFISLSQAPVAYMIAVKRLSLVFGVLMGWLWFGETNIRYRLIGAAIMVTGVFGVYQ